MLGGNRGDVEKIQPFNRDAVKDYRKDKADRRRRNAQVENLERRQHTDGKGNQVAQRKEQSLAHIQ